MTIFVSGWSNSLQRELHGGRNTPRGGADMLRFECADFEVGE